jgi:hypothetical protein
MTSAPLPPDVLAALKAGRPVDAIRLLREQRGIGLKEAHDAMDAFRRDPRMASTVKTRAAPKSVLAGFLPESVRESAPVEDPYAGLSPGEVPRRGRLVWVLVVLFLLATLGYRWLRNA